MHIPIKIADWEWEGSNNKQMKYKDERGEWFIGPPREVVLGQLVMVEITDKPEGDGYRHIIKFVG